MKAKNVYGHILFWVAIILTYSLSEWGYQHSLLQAIKLELLFLPMRLVAVYFNWFYLIPQFLYKNKIFRYLIFLGLTLLLTAIIQRAWIVYFDSSFFPSTISTENFILEIFSISRLLQCAVIITSPVAFSTGIKVLIDWYQEKNKSTQLMIEKREAELKYLKSQISPHFLFNTLNNLYGLSKEGSENVPDLILKLSDFLDYVLYQSSKEFITVGKEIQLIKDYVDIEKYRYHHRVNISYDLDNSLFEYRISPLLFMPLIENAFKHGVHNNSDITHIEVKLFSQNDHLIFRVRNSIPKIGPNDQLSGIGLTNLSRRLELLYSDSSQLSFGLKENGYYESTLAIDFEKEKPFE